MVRETTVQIQSACDADRIDDIFKQIYSVNSIDSLLPAIPENLRAKVNYIHQLYVNPNAASRICAIEGKTLEKFQEKMVKFTKEVLETLEEAKPAVMPIPQNREAQTSIERDIQRDSDIIIDSIIVINDVTSHRGRVTATNCQLNEVKAALNVKLVASFARAVSSQGGVQWNGKLGERQIIYINAVQNIDIQNLPLKMAISSNGQVNANDCTVQEIKSKLDATLIGSYVNDISSSNGALNLTKSFVDTASALKRVALDESNVGQLTLFIPDNDTGYINGGNIDTLVVKLTQGNSSARISIDNTTIVTNVNNAGVRNTKVVGIMFGNCRSDLEIVRLILDSDGSVNSQHDSETSRLRGNGLFLINQRPFKRNSAGKLAPAFPISPAGKMMMTQEELSAYVFKAAGGDKGDNLTVGDCHILGGRFSITNSRVNVLSLPQDWEIIGSASSSSSRQNVKLIIENASIGQLKFEGCTGSFELRNSVINQQITN